MSTERVSILCVTALMLFLFAGAIFEAHQNKEREFKLSMKKQDILAKCTGENRWPPNEKGTD